jgi:NitT/TauT family transport system substrate-binding protein
MPRIPYADLEALPEDARQYRQSDGRRKLKEGTMGGWFRRISGATAMLLLSVAIALPAQAADKVKIGIIKTTSSGPIYIAVERGYFAAAGIEPELIFFDAAQPVAVATVSGDVDVGSTGLTAGFYAFAAQGAVKIIGGQGREAPGFHNLGYFVSNRAFEAGFKSLKDAGGHTIALSQTGSPGHYVVGALAEKYGINLADIKVVSCNPSPISSLPSPADKPMRASRL